MDNYWKELSPMAFSLSKPTVTLELKPIEVMNTGVGPIPTLQFTTVATSAYPAVQGQLSTSGQIFSTPDSGNTVGINVPLSFRFSVNLSPNTNSVAVPAGLKITSAVLTELKITLSVSAVSQRQTVFYLVGASASQTKGGAGTDVLSVSGLTFTPPPTTQQTSSSYGLTVSTSGLFATIATTFSATVGTGSGSMLHFGDGLVNITVEFVATLTLSAGSGTRRRDVSVSGHVLSTRDMNATVSSNVLHLVTHSVSASINVPAQAQAGVSPTTTGGLASSGTTGVLPSSTPTSSGSVGPAEISIGRVHTVSGVSTIVDSSGVVAEPSKGNTINSESGGGGGVGNALGLMIGLAAAALLA
ncbi:hypothetical protein HDU98_001078 [Podochytrium sp. JEL0797]|nr:hypothetical protein HDU98_001078 [Podochytrium sp. JEL0797]